MATDEQPNQPSAPPSRKLTSAGLARLRAEVLAIPPPALAASADYERYIELLPLLVAGLILPGSTDYNWFMEFLLEWPFCATEYMELQELFSSPPDPAGLIVSDDLAFLRQATAAPAASATEIISVTELRQRLELRVASSRRGLQVTFAGMEPPSLAQVAEPTAQWVSAQGPATAWLATAHPSTPTDSSTALLFAVEPEEDTLVAWGLRRLTLVVQPDHNGMCWIQISLAGIATNPLAGPQITLVLANGSILPLPLNAQSRSHSPSIPIAALASTTITIEWPAAP